MSNTGEDTTFSFWSQRTYTEKRLIVAICMVTLLAVSFLVALVTILFLRSGRGIVYIQRTGAELNREDDISICTTPACVHEASRLLLNLDETVNPCHDFYDFACGSFLKHTRIPDDETSTTTFTIVANQLQEQIRTLLEEPIKPEEPRTFVLVKTMYQSCMNTSAIAALGKQPLLDILRNLGGWPVLDGDNWDESSFSWKDSVYHFHDAGYPVNYFLDFFISVDAKNSTKRIINLDQASLGLSREYLSRGFSDKLVQAYYDYMVDIAKLLGAEKSRAEVELKDSLKFEMKLANISLPLEKRRNATILYNPMTIAQLATKFPSIPWLEYINRLLAPQFKVGPREITIVYVPQYITALEKLLRVTPKRVQSNYVMWRASEATLLCLTEALRRRQFAYFTAVTGQTVRGSRWKECSDIISASMSIAVGALYIRKYFNEKSKANALEMVNDIRQQSRKTLNELDWMDDQTRSAALDKADTMALHIAYPQEMLDDKKLTKLYSGLYVSSDKMLESFLNLSRFGTQSRIGRFRQLVNKTDWINHGQPAVVNAFYSPVENSIQFPAGILQGALFSAQRPAYMNYGAIGFIIGHEITHGFDDEGRQFDKDGNLVDWWKEITKQKYLEKAKCIIDQYSNYTVAEVGMKLNGVTTQGENIADNSGIKEAYYAYEAWTKRHGDESRLPGLEKYTPKQLFWLSAANTWCAVDRNEVIKLRITTDVHVPSRFRVIGPLSNMEEFAQDFKCSTGSQMNPPNKCKVW